MTSGADAPRSQTIEERAGTCPVTILGQDDGVYFFLTPEGQLRILKANQLDAKWIASIFAQEIGWLYDAFPKMSKEGVPTGGWNVDTAREFLIRRAHAVGFFRPEKVVRGAGVWIDDGGGLIVHCGDVIMLPGPDTPTALELFSAGIRRNGFIYPASSPETRPAAQPASVEDAKAFFDFLSSWSWRSPVHAPRLLLGFFAGASICGALRWRPHIQLAGNTGTGKTALDRLARDVLGSQTLEVSAPTEPAIRQLLRGAARPVIVDEIETENMARARLIIELARLGSSDDQAPVVRGSTDGKATQWPIRACFMFSSVLYPRYRPQDLARICVLELDQLTIGEREDGTLVQDWAEAEIERFGRMGPQLRRRMINGFARFQQNLRIFERAIGALGQKARVAKQLGTLLACAETMLSDDPVADDAASKLVGDFAIPDITGYDDEQDQDDALAHLLTYPVQVDFQSEGQTMMAIGELIARSRGRAGSYSDRTLRQHGLAIFEREIGDRSFPYLVVANNHRGLSRIFADSRWAEGTWQQAMLRVKDADRGPTNPGADRPSSVSFGGIKQRGSWLPFASLPIEWDEPPPAEGQKQ